MACSSRGQVDTDDEREVMNVHQPTNRNLRCPIVLQARCKINNSVGKFILEFLDEVSNKDAK